MNRTLVLVSALAAGMTSAAGMAQTAGPQSPEAASTAPSAPVAVHAVPAKIAMIEYEQVAAATNEGVRALQALQKKYEPKKNELQTLAQEVDTLKKKLQASSATLSEADRASQTRAIDVKEKQLQRDGEDAQTTFNNELQETLGAVGKKLGPVVIKYVQDNGYTILLDNSGQQGGLSVLWTQPGTTDISQAIVDAYNTSSGIAAPAPAAPAAHPHTTTTPSAKPAAPKQ
jgi:outer membrane protein